MVTKADWIKVELSAEDIDRARHAGTARWTERDRTSKMRQSADIVLSGNILGIAGELAVALYENCPWVPDSYAVERRRGFVDVAGWKVRTRSRARYGLGLNQGDKPGRYLLVLGHEYPPVLWLAGWISYDEGKPAGIERSDGDYNGDRRWVLIEQESLYPLPDQNGYARRGAARWLVDPQTPFWCETCGGMHPIVEHRRCRALSRS